MSNKPLTKKEWESSVTKMWESAIESTYRDLIEKAVQAEREKTLRLWMLLDDVDSADDIAKADDAVYRSLCQQAQAKRWSVLTGDEVDAAIRARGQA
jgi:hypothetical protein